MRELAPLPLSKATDAYELLDEVCTAILEEPRRYDQSSWALTVNPEINQDAPACGTIGCIAGWISILRRKVNRELMSSHRYTVASIIPVGAARELGFKFIATDYESAGYLSNTMPVRQLFHSDLLLDCPAKQGTEEYAECAVKHIRDFQRQHADRLRNHKLEPLHAD